jgi:hypothetical protein
MSHLNSLINDEVKSVYLVVGNDFSISYKKLFEKYSQLEKPMQILHDALNNSKFKESVIYWKN